MPYLEVLQKYAVFDARASRSEYWLFVSIHLVIVATLVTPNPPPNGGEGFGDACRGLDGESVGGQCLDLMVKEA